MSTTAERCCRIRRIIPAIERRLPIVGEASPHCMKYYYADSDKKPVGPLPAEALEKLRAAGIIAGATMVIAEGGSAWKRYSDVFQKAIPSDPPPRLFSSDGSTVSAKTSVRVGNNIVWISAFFPLLYLIPNAICKSNGVSTWYVVPVCFFVNGFVLSADEKNLKALGLDTTPLGGSWLVPIYLFKRPDVVGGGYGYAVCWIVTFLISLL